MRPTTVLRLLATVAAISAAVAPAAGAQAVGASTGDSGRTVVAASGQARQAMTPDRATLFLVIETQGGTADDASTRLAQAERAVLDTLRRLGLSGGAVQAFNYGVTPVRLSPGGPMNQTVLAGRTVVRVEVGRVDQVAPVTRAALAKGVAVIGPPVFAAAGIDSVRRELLPRAFDQARRDAEVMARAAGGRLGRLLELHETGAPFAAEAGTQQVFLSSSVGFGYDPGPPRTPPVVNAVAAVTARWELLAGTR